MTASEHFRRLVTDAYKRSGKGILAFEKDLGLNPSSIKAIVSEGLRQNPSIDKAERIALALGLEFYIGPPRATASGPVTVAARFAAGLTLPTVGFGACDLHGWGAPGEVANGAAPAPLAVDEGEAFWVVAAGWSMRPEGIEAGDYCLVSRLREAAPGDRVWFRDGRGKASIKRLVEIRDDVYVLRGWLPPEAGRQTAFTDDRTRGDVAELRPLLAVFDGFPKVEAPPRRRADPKPTVDSPELQLARRVALALGLAEGASEPDIIAEIKALRAAPPAADLVAAAKEAKAAADRLSFIAARIGDKS